MNAEANIGGSIMRCIDVKSDQLCLNLVDKHLAWFLLIAMRFLRLVKSKFLMFLLGAICLLEALAMTGCVYPVGRQPQWWRATSPTSRARGQRWLLWSSCGILLS